MEFWPESSGPNYWSKQYQHEIHLNWKIFNSFKELRSETFEGKYLIFGEVMKRYGIPARARRVALVHFPGTTSVLLLQGLSPQ